MVSTNSKPVWLLDVDEVLNVNPGRGRSLPFHVWPKDQWRERKVRSNGTQYTIIIAEPVLEFVRMVHEQELATIKWHTSWQHDVHDLARRFDLPHLPILDAETEFAVWNQQRETVRGGWWKLPAVWREVDAGHKVVWTDDEVLMWLTTEQYQALVAAGAHIIIPMMNVGLTPKMLRELLGMFNDNLKWL